MPASDVAGPTGRSTRRATRRDRVLLAAAVLLQLVVLYAPRAPGGGERLGLDKVVHVTVFGLVAVLAVRCGLAWPAVLAVLVAHAAVSELLQHVALPHRDGDVWDAVADSIGATLGTWLGLRTLRGRAGVAR